MKKILALLLLLPALCYSQADLQSRSHISDSIGVGIHLPIPLGCRARVFTRGRAGIFYQTDDGHEVRLDSSGGNAFKLKVSGKANHTDSVVFLAGFGIIIDTLGRDTIRFRADTTINTGNFCDGSDGDSTLAINATITLTRDMCWDTLTMHGGSIINMAGFKIYANAILTPNSGVADSLTYIRNNGGAGGAGAAGGAAGGSSAAAGSAGAATGAGSTTSNGAGVQGGVGGAGTGTCSLVGAVGVTTTNNIGLVGAAGATGGLGGVDDFANTSTASCLQGTGGAAGSFTALAASAGNPRNFIALTTDNQIGNVLRVNGGNGGGGGGGTGWNSDAGNQVGGGGGGGSGASGGWSIVQAKIIYGNITIQANGGAGGNGGAGHDGATSGGGKHGGGGGGGAAGAGGPGGLAVLVYHDGTGWFGSVVAAGGATGTPGAGGLKSGGTATNGAVGGTPSAARTGLTFAFKI